MEKRDSNENANRYAAHDNSRSSDFEIRQRGFHFVVSDFQLNQLLAFAANGQSTSCERTISMDSRLINIKI